MPTSVIDALREALELLEQSKEFQAADPDVLKLRQEIDEAIVKFQAAKSVPGSSDLTSG